MQIIKTVSELRTALNNQAQGNQNQVGFVPTMGNLHAGHISLVEKAKQSANFVVASIFVNPLQFSPSEDLSAYPRTPEADYEKLKAAGCDIIFAPSVLEMYPNFDGKRLHQTMTIKPPPIADQLCGASRPGHFEGVATVVMKLFNIVQPQIAVFGKKDYQQLFIIQDMVRQFNLPIQIVAGETVREPSGLAMSSRNGYLTDAQLAQAAQLYATLKTVLEQLKNGHQVFSDLENKASQHLNRNGWEVDYISIRSALTLMPALPQDKRLVVLVAATIHNTSAGKTRLIDNVEVII